jgi:hypothetical protein
MLRPLLYAQHHLLAHFGYQERVFAVAFHHTAPALVAGGVEYRCVNVGIAQSFCFAANGLPGLAHQLFIPGTADAYWRRQWRGPIMVKPWIPSLVKSTGIPMRVSSTNHFWIVLMADACLLKGYEYWVGASSVCEVRLFSSSSILAMPSFQISFSNWERAFRLSAPACSRKG